MNKLTIEAGKEYKMRGGSKAMVLCIDAPGKYPVKGYKVIPDNYQSHGWTLDGRSWAHGIEHMYDLVAPWSEPVQFDWSCLPKWRNKYVTMDSGGFWYCYQAKPFQCSATWDCDKSEWCQIPHDFAPKNYTGDWKDSLMVNPEI